MVDYNLSTVIKMFIAGSIKYALFDFDKTLTKHYSDNGEITNLTDIIIDPLFYKNLFIKLQENNIIVGIVSFGRYNVISKYISQIMGTKKHNIAIFTPRLYDIKGIPGNYTDAIYSKDNNFLCNEYREFFNHKKLRILTKAQMVSDLLSYFNDQTVKPYQVLYFDDCKEHILVARKAGYTAFHVPYGVTEQSFHMIQYSTQQDNHPVNK